MTIHDRTALLDAPIEPFVPDQAELAPVGHRVLRIIGKGNKPALIPPAPRTARTSLLTLPNLRTGGNTVSTRRALSLWMEGAGPRHPIADLDLPDDVLGSLDEILGLVEQAQPGRIARKRQAFRGMTQLRELLEQRTELLAASLPLRSGVPFEFAADHPDLMSRRDTNPSRLDRARRPWVDAVIRCARSGLAWPTVAVGISAGFLGGLGDRGCDGRGRGLVRVCRPSSLASVSRLWLRIDRAARQLTPERRC